MWRTLLAAIVGCATLSLAGCGNQGQDGGVDRSGANAKGEEKRLNAGGATFIFPMMSKWSSVYDKEKGVKVNYQSIGSGGGIQQMTAKTFDFGCTDAPMNDEQLKKAAEVDGEVVHIPLAMGGDVPAYNLPGIEEPLKFTGPVLADIFLGKIKKWNDPALAALNGGVNLPDQEIAVVHRSEGSGTTYIWVDYLSKVSEEWKEKVGVGTSVKWPTGVGQKGNEGVAGYITRSPGSIGYIELIYAKPNNIKFGSVKNKEGAFVLASLESVTAAAKNALKVIPSDLRYSITDPEGKDSYPISGTNWAVLYVKQPPEKGKAIVDFLRWVTHEGQEYTAALQYARLPEGLVKLLEQKLDQVNVGK
jgi:phosphate transport system substrate-binding protein